VARFRVRVGLLTDGLELVGKIQGNHRTGSCWSRPCFCPVAGGSHSNHKES
jgi:hypothetical protein